MEEAADEIAALETLCNEGSYLISKRWSVPSKYYAGWADKIHGQVVEVKSFTTVMVLQIRLRPQTDERKLNYTRHEPIGVVGQIVPWNGPHRTWYANLRVSTVNALRLTRYFKALAAGSTIVLKPSEMTPLSALRVCMMVEEAGFPPGVLNVVTGYGTTVGAAISSHMKIDKVAFTGSTASPNIIFNDADLDQAVKWAAHGIFFNQGQVCFAGSRIYVQSGIYDEFLAKFTERTKMNKLGDPFSADVYQGPQISPIQADRIMDYVNSGKDQGAKIHLGGERQEGNFVTPTIFTETKPDMEIVQEEIFGPVSVVIKFEDRDGCLAAAVFTQNLTQAIEVGHAFKAGTIWVNCCNELSPSMPFGGYKQSDLGREFGSYALEHSAMST
ncbi:hypothetical protein GYMLUDRAFT_247783 [Collybiopsis luxurians FD-317 M1]|uniref:Aldehyde dehydrogenase domain-containing protein n=1 Tax=Collybiopsis luxurians FD-317 M1 TaxID=944289 RepID=A0A0D0BNK1_9AGAR|nr:hypothetical protein GYMLUDRAFT_247783 [Collybiopsis luxurians FD-317 M1]